MNLHTLNTQDPAPEKGSVQEKTNTLFVKQLDQETAEAYVSDSYGKVLKIVAEAQEQDTTQKGKKYLPVLSVEEVEKFLKNEIQIENGFYFVEENPNYEMTIPFSNPNYDPVEIYINSDVYWLSTTKFSDDDISKDVYGYIKNNSFRASHRQNNSEYFYTTGQKDFFSGILSPYNDEKGNYVYLLLNIKHKGVIVIDENFRERYILENEKVNLAFISPISSYEPGEREGNFFVAEADLITFEDINISARGEDVSLYVDGKSNVRELKKGVYKVVHYPFKIYVTTIIDWSKESSTPSAEKFVTNVETENIYNENTIVKFLFSDGTQTSFETPNNLNALIRQSESPMYDYSGVLPAFSSAVLGIMRDAFGGMSGFQMHEFFSALLNNHDFNFLLEQKINDILSQRGL